jgi:hypothetical protein
MTTPPYHRALVPKKADGEPEAERWHPPPPRPPPGRALLPCVVPPLSEGGGRRARRRSTSAHTPSASVAPTALGASLARLPPLLLPFPEP